MASPADQKVAVKIVGDTTDFDARMQGVERTLDRVGKGGVASLGAQGKLSALQLQQVSYQLNDLAVQIASGGNPFTALLQQGSQLSGTFGGVGNTIRALVGAITPAGAAIATTAAAVGALALAYTQGHDESVRLNDSLIVTGNFAGQTAASIDAMAKRIAALDARPIGAVRDGLMALVASGQVGPQAIEPLERALESLRKFTGQSVPEIAGKLAALARDPAKAAADLNREYNFLTPAVFQQIRALEAQGKAQEAAAVAANALSEKFADQRRNLGFLETAYDGAKRALGGLWDAMKDIGRDDNVDKAMARVQKRLDDLLSIKRQGRLFIPNPFEREGFDIDKEIAKYQGSLDALRNSQALSADVARRQAAADRKNQQEIERQQRDYQNALLSLDKAGFDQRQALTEVSLAKQSAALEDAFRQQLISQADYVERRYAIEKAGIDLRRRVVEEDIALEKRRQAEKPAEAISITARIKELEAQRDLFQKEYDALDAKRRRGELAGPPRNMLESPGTSFRLSELGQSEDLQRSLLGAALEGSQRARQFGIELRDRSAALNADLIKDDRARGEAQIELEREQLQRQLVALDASAEQRKKIEDDVAGYIAARHAQLDEELKPAYQKLLESWADTVQNMRRRWDEAMTGFIETGRDAFVEFVTTGKVNVRSLVGFIEAEFARMVYERYLSQAVASLGSSIFGSLFGGTAGAAVAGVISGGTGLKLPGRASGGPVDAGTTYLVGERGPELFTPATSGTVTPNGAPGGGIVFQTNVAAGPTRNEIVAAITASNAALEQRLMARLRAAGVV